MKLDGQTVVITGANTGIGKATATELARRNARVIMACRDKERGLKACSEIKQLSGSDKVVVRQLDLASLESIRKFASHVLEEEHHIDILINNAGNFVCMYVCVYLSFCLCLFVCLFVCPVAMYVLVLGVMAYSFWRTADGFEMQLGVNHLGHFLLTNLLLNQIKESVPSRIINVSSRLYKRGQINFGDLHNKERYSGVRAYSQSKLANILFTRQLAERLEGTGVTVYSVSPGFVRTELGRHFLRASILYKLLYVILYPIYWLVSKSPEQGAETIIYCAVAEELEVLYQEM